jgi:hypothetical protein
MGSRLLREYQEAGRRDEQFEIRLPRLDSALAKAPLYSGVVYRGTAASPLWQSYVDDLRRLVASGQALVGSSSFECEHLGGDWSWPPSPRGK